jgi:hypothetical protein
VCVYIHIYIYIYIYIYIKHRSHSRLMNRCKFKIQENKSCLFYKVKIWYKYDHVHLTSKYEFYVVVLHKVGPLLILFIQINWPWPWRVWIHLCVYETRLYTWFRSTVEGSVRSVWFESCERGAGYFDFRAFAALKVSIVWVCMCLHLCVGMYAYVCVCGFIYKVTVDCSR